MGKQNRKRRIDKKRQKAKPRLPLLVFNMQNTPFGRVIFTRRNLLKHIADHPELGSQEFIEEIKDAIKNPQLVFIDLRDQANGSFILYNKIDKSYNPFNPNDFKVRYVKVVLGRGRIRVVATAFERDYIKEKKRWYPNKVGFYE